MNLEKDMKVGSGSYGYKAISDNSVVLAVKRAEEKYGLVSFPIRQEILSQETIKKVSNDGKESYSFVETIRMTLRVVDLDAKEMIEGLSYVDVESIGKGVDSSDKGPGKASTYARKYALLNLYKIATGEDPDANKSEPIKSMNFNEKKIEICHVCDTHPDKLEKIKSFYAVNSIDDLKAKEIHQIYKKFKKDKLV